MAPRSQNDALPAHIVETIDCIAGLRSQHEERRRKGQQPLRSAVGFVTRPGTLKALLLAAGAWAAMNGAGEALGYDVIDPAPFFWLDTVLAISSLCVTLTILSIQRRDDELAALREQLALELAILSEQKSAKIIELVEELRRDLPHVPNRQDDQAAEMAKSADPTEVIKAIERSREPDSG